MAKNKDVKPIAQNVIEQSLEEVMHSSMMPYAEYVIMERALPRVEDGLKPVQRRILYTMMELAMWPDKPHRKSARIVGDCLGKYHPHGDTSVYDAMVRMAQEFNMSVPLVDGHGNFGSIDGDTAAAMRYTEARLTPAALLLLKDIDKNTVDYSLNFDDTLKEPDVLPGRFPNLLVNGATGIAVGLATNIPPHNIQEVIQGTIALLKNPEMTLKQMMKIIKGPDFPTGGFCTSDAELLKAYETGRGRLQIRAKTEIERDKDGKQRIVVTELPFQVNKASMLERILKLSEDKKEMLSGISDIRDESDREGIRAVIELRRDADADQILAYLHRYSDLQVTFGVNIVAIADGRPMQMGLLDILHYYINYQKEVVRRRTQYDLDAAERREHILQGLMVAVNNIDEVIAIIRNSKNVSEARPRLMERFKLSEIQAQAILDMRLKRLTALDTIELEKEYDEIVTLVKSLKAVLGSETRLNGVIVAELEQISEQFIQKRKTVMKKDLDIDESEFMPEVVSEPCMVVLTHQGYFKRTVLRGSGALSQSFTEDMRFQLSCMSQDSIRVFTDLGNMYTILAEEIDETRGRARGTNITNIVEGMEKDEKVIAMLSEENGENGELIFFTKDGMCKRSAEEDYQTNRQKLRATGLRKDDVVIYVQSFEKGKDILLITKMGMAIRFDSESVPSQGRTASGVIGIALDKGDEVLFAMQIAAEEELAILSDRGYGKRMPTNELEQQGRNGKGSTIMPFNKDGSNGQMLAAILEIQLTDNIAILQEKGTETTVMASEFAPETSRGKGIPIVLALFDDVVISAKQTSAEVAEE